jgi:hypothetical protein
LEQALRNAEFEPDAQRVIHKISANDHGTLRQAEINVTGACSAITSIALVQAPVGGGYRQPGLQREHPDWGVIQRSTSLACVRSVPERRLLRVPISRRYARNNAVTCSRVSSGTSQVAE